MAQRSNAAKTETKPKRQGAKPDPRTAAKEGPSRARPAIRWQGDAVEETGPTADQSTAEEAASRAEGNAPLRAEDAAHGAGGGTFLDRKPARTPARGADDAENIEEKRQSAAEDHAQGPGHGPIRGRL